MLFTRHDQFSSTPQNGVITKWNDKFQISIYVFQPFHQRLEFILPTMAVYNTLEPVKNLLKQKLAPVF